MQLTEEQEAAIADESSLVCVKAMPGSGKTRLVVEKARRLLDADIEPWILTFTNRAGNEIKERIFDATGQELSKCGTFHSIFHDPDDRICSEDESKSKYWREEGYITFDMVLQRAIERGISSPPSYVIVDECQDNDTQQWRLLEILREAGAKAFVVGDLDQSIYQWRGARPEMAHAVFREAHDTHGSLHYLKRNFRCADWIQDCATKFLGDQQPLTASEIKHAHSESMSDCLPNAILCRTNRDVDRMTHVLMEQGISVAVTVDRKCLQKFAAWMGLIAYPYSVSKFVSATGVGGSVLAKTRTLSMQTERPLVECLAKVDPCLIPQVNLPPKIEVLHPDLIVQVYAGLCGGTVQAGMHLAKQFGSHTPEEAASESCLSMIAPVDGDGVQVMTMHQAKGLEFGHVGIACGRQYTTMNDELARLVYVALTRARNAITLIQGRFSDCGLTDYPLNFTNN